MVEILRAEDAGRALADYSPGPHFGGGEFPLLRHVVGLTCRGIGLEFGVAAGTSLGIIAERMPVIGFDSFEGLPEDWRPGFPKGCMACDPPQVDNALVVAGWFTDTLPGFDFAALDIGLVHVDCDIYSATVTVLEHVGPHLKPGCYVVFDDWFAHGYPPRIARRNEQRAWREFVADRDIQWDVVGRSDQEWAICLK